MCKDGGEESLGYKDAKKRAMERVLKQRHNQDQKQCHVVNKKPNSSALGTPTLVLLQISFALSVHGH